MGKVVITRAILNAGKSFEGGWSASQLFCLKSSTMNNKGWKRRLIGSRVPEEDVAEFIWLRNQHLSQSQIMKHIDIHNKAIASLRYDFEL